MLDLKDKTQPISRQASATRDARGHLCRGGYAFLRRTSLVPFDLETRSVELCISLSVRLG
jgi:hypothetical protein